MKEKYMIAENDKYKMLRSKSYNYNFDKSTGYFERWGKIKSEDSEWSPFGPEIADIEISTICHQGCEFCYKSNTTNGKNMNLETFIQIYKKLPNTLTQIAFGVGSIDANPDLFKIFDYCRKSGIIPNVTINSFRMTGKYYDNLIKYCGAVAVSLYDYDSCYDAVKNLGECGLKQVNIHALLSEETYDKCIQVLKDTKTDDRLKNYLNAIVFLWLKPKGRGVKLHQISREKYNILVNYAITNNISIGFDSCSASNFLKCDNTNQFKEYIEPCESTLFSIYINTDGLAYPCSFTEDNNGIDIIKSNFLPDVWMSKRFINFRDTVINNKDENGCRMCPIYDLKI